MQFCAVADKKYLIFKEKCIGFGEKKMVRTFIFYLRTIKAVITKPSDKVMGGSEVV